MKDLKSQFKEKYFKIFSLHFCEQFKTVKLAYHLIPLEVEPDVNKGQYYFVTEERFPNSYKLYDLNQPGKDKSSNSLN